MWGGGGGGGGDGRPQCNPRCRISRLDVVAAVCSSSSSVLKWTFFDQPLLDMKKKNQVPSRLGPPPQLLLQADHLTNKSFPKLSSSVKMQEQKFQPKMREIASRQVKLVAKWIHVNLTWKKVLMSWMVLLAASKMVLLMLTYQFFTLTALISLQVFHGVWTIAFFCLSLLETGGGRAAVLPNASCLLAGYLPATTVLHILLMPNDYPLEFIITDAVGTFLAIITFFILLRLECTEILHQAEHLFERERPVANSSSNSDDSSESGSSSSCSSKASSRFNGVEIDSPNGRRIMGNPCGPTIIAVGDCNNNSNNNNRKHHPDDSMRFGCSMEEEEEETSAVAVTTSAMDAAMFDEAVDLEPIDFEHFVEEPDLHRNQSERMFQVTLGSSPPTRGR